MLPLTSRTVPGQCADGGRRSNNVSAREWHPCVKVSTLVPKGAIFPFAVMAFRPVKKLGSAWKKFEVMPDLRE
jgi:hypothetical protein